MCELFGISSKNNTEINNYLNTFYSHCNTNPHGWGIAIMEKNKNTIKKEPIKASDSTYLKEILKKPIKVVEPIIKYIKSLQELEKLGYNIKDVIEEMKSKQWLTVETDWIHKPKNIYKGETKSEKNSQAIDDYFNKYEIPVIEDCEVTVNENTT